jgi:hypothetical protein
MLSTTKIALLTQLKTLEKLLKEAANLNPTNSTISEIYTYFQDIPHLDLAGTGPCQVGDTIKILASKSSTDLHCINIKLLKEVRAEIEAPLAHTFNFSLTTGCFPERLQASKVVLIHKAPTVTTRGL